jgi:uncharacterized membrane protein YdjX (TVP38/TMEM64 family)
VEIPDLARHAWSEPKSTAERFRKPGCRPAQNQRQFLEGGEMKRPADLSQWLKAADRRNILVFAGAALLLVVAIVAAGDEIKHHVGAIEAWIEGLGPWGVVGFVAIYVAATSLLFPESALSIIAGALFGIAWGLAAAALAMLLAAVLQYTLARRLLRGRIERLLAARPLLASIERAVRRQELRLQLLLRLAPLNPATISYLLGAAGVRFGGFMLACLAVAPHLLLEVYFGYAGRHVAHMAARDHQELYVHDLAVLGGLAIAMVVLALVSKMAYKAVLGAVAESREASAPGQAPG